MNATLTKVDRTTYRLYDGNMDEIERPYGLGKYVPLDIRDKDDVKFCAVLTVVPIGQGTHMCWAGYCPKHSFTLSNPRLKDLAYIEVTFDVFEQSSNQVAESITYLLSVCSHAAHGSTVLSLEFI